MSKVFIVTEQELAVHNSGKQTELLHFIWEQANTNPDYDLTTLITLAQQKIAADTAQWEYKELPAPAQPVAEEPSEEVEVAGADNVHSDPATFEEAQEELIAEQNIDNEEEFLPEEIVEEPAVENFDETVEGSVDEELNETSEEEENDLPDEDTANTTPKRNKFVGLFHELGKIDKIS